MKKRLIVTDSVADLPAEIVAKHGIHILPVNVILDGKTFKDGVDISRDEFYQNYYEYEEMSTAPVSYEDYALEFLNLVQKYDELLIIHCSSHLSETFNTALKVVEDFQGQHQCRVKVIDSGLASMGQGMVVMAAAQAMAAGKPLESAEGAVYATRAQMSNFMAIPTLKYLRKGKKISGLKALFGVALGVKPVLEFEDGKLTIKDKLFGKQKNMILAMMDKIRDDIGNKPITLAIVHAKETTPVENLKGVFESSFNCRKIFSARFGPSLGINTGPETYAVMYIKHAA